MKPKSKKQPQRKPENVTYQAVVKQASAFLKEAGREGEMAERYLMDVNEWTLTDWIVKKNQSFPEAERMQYWDAMQKIVQEEWPYQYLTGRAWFYHYPFHVTPDTLIPRQETELLVSAVLKHIQKENISKTAKVLDIGTGSGAIAVTLKLECPTLNVTATDLSPAALVVAEENAHQLQSGAIDFRVGDLFEPVLGEMFDVIVSNPPYIAEDEIDVMGSDVLRHEPPQALFAKNHGYAIYWRILRKLKMYIRPGGYFLAECGYKQGPTLKEAFQSAFPKEEVTLISDYAGIERILVVHFD
ncbi:MAG: peptide chain release factor N(5)-glutamine methyltransferase [Aerococcus sp.]|nr:peptide chain release factor N(5)-glutamine methyltransferase [Aerococcus sp.]